MSESASQFHIDFEQWSSLASTDPEGFEARRSALLEAAIRRAPHHKQHRLRCLQWKLDQVRRTARTPMAACLRMNRMMWDLVLGEDGLRDNLTALRGGAPVQQRPRAPVVQLNRARESRGLS